MLQAMTSWKNFEYQLFTHTDKTWLQFQYYFTIIVSLIFALKQGQYMYMYMYIYMCMKAQTSHESLYNMWWNLSIKDLWNKDTFLIRGIDEKFVPHTGDFDIQIYAHEHMRTIKCNKLATP